MSAAPALELKLKNVLDKKLVMREINLKNTTVYAANRAISEEHVKTLKDAFDDTGPQPYQNPIYGIIKDTDKDKALDLDCFDFNVEIQNGAHQAEAAKRWARQHNEPPRWVAILFMESDLVLEEVFVLRQNITLAASLPDDLCIWVRRLVQLLKFHNGENMDVDTVVDSVTDEMIWSVGYPRTQNLSPSLMSGWRYNIKIAINNPDIWDLFEKKIFAPARTTEAIKKNPSSNTVYNVILVYGKYLYLLRAWLLKAGKISTVGQKNALWEELGHASKLLKVLNSALSDSGLTLGNSHRSHLIGAPVTMVPLGKAKSDK